MTDRFRIFIDSNVLFSASYKPDHPFLIFWTSSRARPVTSDYVVGETKRHARGLGHTYRLNELVAKTEIIVQTMDSELPGIDLPEKDRPILSGALAAKARYLVTGDKNHFGAYFDQTLATSHGSMTILEPAALRRLLRSLE